MNFNFDPFAPVGNVFSDLLTGAFTPKNDVPTAPAPTTETTTAPQVVVDAPKAAETTTVPTVTVEAPKVDAAPAPVIVSAPEKPADATPTLDAASTLSAIVLNDLRAAQIASKVALPKPVESKPADEKPLAIVVEAPKPVRQSLPQSVPSQSAPKVVPPPFVPPAPVVLPAPVLTQDMLKKPLLPVEVMRPPVVVTTPVTAPREKVAIPIMLPPKSTPVPETDGDAALARKLQEEEERHASGVKDTMTMDATVAQVLADEELARKLQHEEEVRVRGAQNNKRPAEIVFTQQDVDTGHVQPADDHQKHHKHHHHTHKKHRKH